MGTRGTLLTCLLAVLPRMGLADDTALVWPAPAWPNTAAPEPQLGFSLQLGGSFSVRPQVALPAMPGRAAAVFVTDPLPDSSARKAQGKLQVGMGWQGARASAYYGVTYLTPQFSNQPEGQLIGSFSLSLRF